MYILPAQPTPLIGRESDIAGACARLAEPSVRLLTVVGPPGVGKTRLALAVAARLAPASADGAAFVDLAPLADPALVPAAIARSLGIREDGRGPLIEQIAGTLSETQMLLILDNYEHLLVAAPVVAHLLAASPGLRVLATSRSPLGLRWEHRFPLAPLDDGAARRLFVERARAISPDITSDATTEPLIARICARLDRLPLAIELAAARAGALSLGGLVERLEQGIGALGGGPRDLPARQRTLRDAIAWSYDLLAEPERLLFRHLAVFPGGATAEAAAAIADQAPPATLDTLASLRESGLLQPPAADGEPRFRMLATVREFAHEQLIAAGEAVDVNRRLVVRMLTLAQEAEPGLRSGGREPWLARLDAEQDNIRAALAWCAEDPASLEAGLRLAATLEWFWHFRNHWREAHDWLERLLARTDEAASNAPRAAALRVAGRFAVFLGLYERARHLLEEAIATADKACAPLIRALALVFLTRRGWQAGEPASERLSLASESVSILRGTGDVWWLALALFYLGDTCYRMGDRVAAQAACDESVRLFRTSGDAWGVALSDGVITSILLEDGAWADARRLTEEHLAELRLSGEKLAIAVTIQTLGNLARLAGDAEAAEVAHTEALALHRDLGNVGGAAMSLRGLGYVALARGDERRAAELFHEGLSLIREHSDVQTIAWFLVGVAEMDARRGAPESAVRLLGAVEALLEAGGARQGPIARADFVRAEEAVRLRLGGDACTSAWGSGRKLSRAAAVDEALSVVARCLRDTEHGPAASPHHARRARASAGPHGLTRRETEILALLASGLSNREIAEALVVSIRTVEHHVARLYAKIGARRRADATAFAVQNGLALTGASPM